MPACPGRWFLGTRLNKPLVLQAREQRVHTSTAEATLGCPHHIGASEFAPGYKHPKNPELGLGWEPHAYKM